MKALIIGIDGGTKKIFEGMPMPFLHSKIEKYQGPELEADLVSRGWAEQVSGMYADETKAFYVYPDETRNRKVTMRYSLGDLMSVPGIRPIWEIPQQAGLSVGIMNIPTTFPAPEVSGFFVSGAGGGLNKVDGVPKEMCYPADLAGILAEREYIVDIRMGTSSFATMEQLFNRLRTMMKVRTDAFIDLALQHKVDFGFLAYRYAAILQYTAMSEISAYIDKLPQSSVWREMLPVLYKEFDEQLEKIFVKLKPEHWIFSSDHGVGDQRFFINPNIILQKLGFQCADLKILRTIKRSIINREYFPVKMAHWEKTQAFSDWYTPGIFLNDAERFGGPVQNEQLNELAELICNALNSSTDMKQLGITAAPYRKKKVASRYESLCPDIKLSQSEGNFIASSQGPFVRRNPNYGDIKDISRITGGMHSGNKNPYPFFCTDHNTLQLINPDDPRDLTLVYKLIQRIFN